MARETEDWIKFAMLGIGGYIVYRLLSKAGEIADGVIDAIAKPIANTIIRFTLPEPVNVTGAAILPDGRAIPFASLYVQHTPNSENFWFAYQGATYQLGPRSAQGNYPTRKIQ